MKMRRTIFIILTIYISQILFAPLIHCLSEKSERDCDDCCTGVVINSTCTDTNGPCRNPAHHHHRGHRHDPAQCSFCKIFFKDIGYVPICCVIISDYITRGFSRTLEYSATLLRRSSLIRAPPLKNFLT